MKSRVALWFYAPVARRTNDGFFDPPGMDARRARSDRDVARARGQKNRVSKDLRATKREAGSLPDRREG